ncbi:uncharacterized protein VTP21DRAFT_7101 [Calcarisporiella thermophila]|uniref:uncharacterized protein n=1 Tax=Calcarisporiella thermophila TaxID=911321 RepID=UPI00374414F2
MSPAPMREQESEGDRSNMSYDISYFHPSRITAQTLSNVDIDDSKITSQARQKRPSVSVTDNAFFPAHTAGYGPVNSNPNAYSLTTSYYNSPGLNSKEDDAWQGEQFMQYTKEYSTNPDNSNKSVLTLEKPKYYNSPDLESNLPEETSSGYNSHQVGTRLVDDYRKYKSQWRYPAAYEENTPSDSELGITLDYYSEKPDRYSSESPRNKRQLLTSVGGSTDVELQGKNPLIKKCSLPQSQPTGHPAGNTAPTSDNKPLPGISQGDHQLINGRLIPKSLLDPKIQVQVQERRKWRPYFTWAVSTLQAILLIVEFILYHKMTGKVIETNPFNFMIGPSAQSLIYFGGRFVPCMRMTPDIDKLLPCPNATDLQAALSNTGNLCTLADICGFNGFPSGQPDQAFRFITPIFLHGGIVHLLFNMLFQLSTGSRLEVDLGLWRYGLIYLSSGVGGFIFGGNFAPTRITSVGASGALFGVVGAILVDLIANWNQLERPRWEFFKLILTIAISFGLGLLPFLDNFSHIGGFICGVLSSVFLGPAIYFGKSRRRFYLGMRILAFTLLVAFYAGLLYNFYHAADPSASCPWCKFLSCLPINGYCEAYQ